MESKGTHSDGIQGLRQIDRGPVGNMREISDLARAEDGPARQRSPLRYEERKQELVCLALASVEIAIGEVSGPVKGAVDAAAIVAVLTAVRRVSTCTARAPAGPVSLAAPFTPYWTSTPLRSRRPRRNRAPVPLAARGRIGMRCGENRTV
jgi:hypothetical protein